MLLSLAFSRNELCCALVVVLVLATPTFAEQDQGATTGNIDSLIGQPIPASPKGFSSSKVLFNAISRGLISPIDQSISFPDVELKRNVSYSNAAGERGVLDLYSPKETQQPGIGLILVHGGGWRAGSKEDYRYYGQQFAHRGIVAACINYRLVPHDRFPTQIQDVKCAIRWMRANAQMLNVDPDRIAIMGGSAGGHLSLLAAYAADVDEFEDIGGHDKVSSQVQGVINIYGPTDLEQDFAKANEMVPGLISDFLGDTENHATENIQLASPLTYLDETAPPTLILHGTIDDLVPIAQADRLAVRLHELGIPYVYDRIEGWPHAMDIAKPINDRVLFLAEKFLSNALKNAPE